MRWWSTMAERHGVLADVHVLGPLRVRVANTWIGIEARRQRLVFGVLLVHAGRVVAAERLLDEVWAGDAPQAGLQALRYHLSKLRDLLAPGRERGDGGPIETIGSGYRLVVAPVHIDAARFELLATQGARLAADRRWARAAEVCTEALELWRGRAWEDFRYEAFAQPEIRRLEERRLACLEDCLDARLATGASQHHVVAELRELNTRHPLRERFWAQTMIALYRAGRVAEAARAYELARHRLRDDLGVEPGPLLQRLHREVLDQSLSMNETRSGTSQVQVAGVQLVAAGDPAPAPRSMGRRVMQHDAPPALVERRDALAGLHAVHARLDVDGGRVAIVRGEAGIGKTAVVRQFLHDLEGRADALIGACDDLATPQPLAPVWDVAREVVGLARALQLDDRRAVMDVLLDLLARPGRGTVLVLEDIQWADDATLDAVTFLGRRVTGVPGMLVLTYRDAMVAPDRAVRSAIGSLPARALVRIDLARLSPAGVAKLVGGAALDPDGVARTTGGNPLFVRELVASGLSGDLPTSIRDVVLARLDRLPDNALDLVRTLSVLPGGADWNILEDLVRFEPSALDAAVAEELIVVDDDRVTFRHELQRRAVLDALPRPVRRRRHRAVLVALGDDAPAATIAHHAVRAEDDTLLRATVPPAARAALRAGNRRDALTLFRLLQGHLDHYAITEAASLAEDWARTARQLDGREAVELTLTAVDLYRRAEDPAALARALAFGAYVLAESGRAAQGRVWAAEAVDLLEAAGPSRDYAFALAEQARLLANLADDDRAARVVARRAVEVAEAIGDTRQASCALAHEGVLLLRGGDRTGVERLGRARVTAADAGHGYEEADAMMLLAGQVRRSDPDRAAELLQRAQAIAVAHELDGLGDFLQAMRALDAVQRSAWAEAEHLAVPVVDGRLGNRSAAWHVLAAIDSRRGAASAPAVVDHAWSVARQVDLTYFVESTAAIVAEHLWTSGRRDPALVDRLDAVLDAGIRAAAPHRPLSALAMSMWLLDRLPIVPASLSPATRAIVEGDAQRAIAARAHHGQSVPLALALLHGTDGQALSAVRMFDDVGALGLAARARAMAEERGVTTPSGSERERGRPRQPSDQRAAEVLSLLASGADEDEISRALLLTPAAVRDQVVLLLRHFDVADASAIRQRHKAISSAVDA